MVVGRVKEDLGVMGLKTARAKMDPDNKNMVCLCMPIEGCIAKLLYGNNVVGVQEHKHNAHQ